MQVIDVLRNQQLNMPQRFQFSQRIMSGVRLSISNGRAANKRACPVTLAGGLGLDEILMLYRRIALPDAFLVAIGGNARGQT